MPTPLLLLVDDAPELADIIAYLGKRSGIEVASCRDVPSAWDYLQTRRPDLLLVDVNLPGLSGPDLCRRVRSTPALAELSIALFSHWGLPADVAAGVEAGADFVVSKELVSRPAELEERLLQILGTRDGRGLTDRVAWQGEVAGAPIRPDWPAALNQALRTAALRLVGPEVLRVVVRRALSLSRTPPLAEPVIARCVTADGLVVDTPALSAAPDSDAVARLVVSLAGQMRRLLGAEASRPFREALAGVVPGLSGLSSH
jgi:DNA-binding response OmpR family regulator